MKQNKQKEWHEQWEMLRDDELFLFQEWILPNTLEDFRGKDVLECGCGGGQHTSFVAPYAATVVAVDLNTVDLAKERNRDYHNISYIEDDIANMNLGQLFDFVFCIGVVHHTDDPDKTVNNLMMHVKTGGKLILWVYSMEGNSLVAKIVEPVRKRFLKNMKRKSLLRLSKFITFLMYFPIYTIYLLPIKGLPFYEYFKNFRRLSFYRNTLNVFDKLNAPQVQFIEKKRIENWFHNSAFNIVNIDSYKGVSWRVTAKKN